METPPQTPALTPSPVKSVENILVFPASQIKIFLGIHFIMLTITLILVGLMYYNNVKQQQLQTQFRPYQTAGAPHMSQGPVMAAAPAAAAVPASAPATSVRPK